MDGLQEQKLDVGGGVRAGASLAGEGSVGGRRRRCSRVLAGQGLPVPPQGKPPSATLSTLELNLGCHGRFKRECRLCFKHKVSSAVYELCSHHLTPNSKPSWEGSIMTPT